MTNENDEFKEEVDMWTLSGFEAHRMLLDEGVSVSDFCRVIGRTRVPVERQFTKAKVNPWYRDQIIAYLGEPTYWRCLIDMRRKRNMPTSRMQARYNEIVKRAKHGEAPKSRPNVVYGG